ncbi:MAG: hypothetical protein ACRDKE_04985 [Solirubrobacterales bacterium]
MTRRAAITLAGVAVFATLTAILISKLTEPSARTDEQFAVQYDSDGFSSGEVRDGGPTPQSGASPRTGAVAPERWQKAARNAARRANALGGSTAVAVWADPWAGPVVAGPTSKPDRMWSSSKPVVAVALLQAEAANGSEPTPGTLSAMRRAIVRSENCRQRQVVAALQEAAGGPGDAIDQFLQTLSAASASDVEVSSETVAPAGDCVGYLRTQQDALKDPLQDAIQLGTASWTPRDAVGFAHYLGTGGYGEAGEQVLDLMRIPKQVSTEIDSPSEYTAALDWGAGKAFAGLEPAYKSGWGGVTTQNFLASQVVYVKGDDGVGYAAVVVFHPDKTPNGDDPGRTPAPSALRAAFKTLREEM